MTITIAQFLTQLRQANLWPALKIDKSLWELFAFDDDGAHYVSDYGRKCFAKGDALDHKLHRLFHGGE